jgi:hypothetical protein
VHFVEELEARHVRQPEVKHAAVEDVVEQQLHGFLASADSADLDVGVVEEVDEGLPLDVVVFYDQEPLLVRRDVILDPIERLLEIFRRRGLHEVGERAVR